MPSFDKALDAIAALREALAAPEPEPVALESVHLTRDTRGMCVVRVNGRVAIRDNGDIIDHMATLEWFAAPPAAPASQWMPIETAPKDGALFLCWVDAVRCGETDEGQQYEEDVSQLDFCYWRTQSDTPDGGWFDPCCGQIGDRQRVTHWMPLPAAPDNLRDAAEKVAPAAPVVPNGCEKIFTHKWLDPDCIEQGCKSLAAPVVREPQPEPVQRLMRFAGKKRSEVSNPCLTAREAIVIADWMQAHGITGASK